MSRFSLGIDVGTSSIKVSLLAIDTATVVGSAVCPEQEMRIIATQPGWAEQDPEEWWSNVVRAVQLLATTCSQELRSVVCVGLSYQEHGLVLIDDRGSVIRPAIIWCDGRAVATGDRLYGEIGASVCSSRLLNSPANFTASKLAWVKDNEPAHVARAAAVLLPGDYIAYRLTGERSTTIPGLSEQMLFDYSDGTLASFVLDHIGIDQSIIPPRVDSFGFQGKILPERAAELGLPASSVVSFRAGDQHCNAFGMSVLDPGQAAVAAGTSGVVFAVTDRKVNDAAQRTNTFVHVNHTESRPRYAVIMCVNGAAIAYRWFRDLLRVAGDIDYRKLNEMSTRGATKPELVFFPFGNGSERTLGNRDLHASLAGLDFNRHSVFDVARSIVNGVAFAMYCGVELLDDLGVPLTEFRAGNAGLFLNPAFATAFCNTAGAPLQLYDTDPAIAAARAAAVGAGYYSNMDEALSTVAATSSREPDVAGMTEYQDAYHVWKTELETRLDAGTDAGR